MSFFRPEYQTPLADLRLECGEIYHDFGRDLHTYTGIHPLICEYTPSLNPLSRLTIIPFQKITYALSGHDLNIAIIFSSLQLFNVSQTVYDLFIPLICFHLDHSCPTHLLPICPFGFLRCSRRPRPNFRFPYLRGLGRTISSRP